MNGNLFVFRPRGNPGRERLQRLAVAHERHVRRGGRKMLEFDDSLIAPLRPCQIPAGTWPIRMVGGQITIVNQGDVRVFDMGDKSACSSCRTAFSGCRHLDVPKPRHLPPAPPATANQDFSTPNVLVRNGTSSFTHVLSEITDGFFAGDSSVNPNPVVRKWLSRK